MTAFGPNHESCLSPHFISSPAKSHSSVPSPPSDGIRGQPSHGIPLFGWTSCCDDIRSRDHIALPAWDLPEHGAPVWPFGAPSASNYSGQRRSALVLL